MTKLTKVGSIEHALRQVLDILREDGARNAIREVLGLDRSPSLLRKCADPDATTHNLQLRYAVALDAHCLKVDQTTPLLEAYNRLMNTYSSGRLAGLPTEERLMHSVLRLQSALGDLSQTVSEGFTPDSLGGKHLTNRERHAMFEALEAVDQQSEEIKLAISY